MKRLLEPIIKNASSFPLEWFKCIIQCVFKSVLIRKNVRGRLKCICLLKHFNLQHQMLFYHYSRCFLFQFFKYYITIILCYFLVIDGGLLFSLGKRATLWFLRGLLHLYCYPIQKLCRGDGFHRAIFKIIIFLLLFPFPYCLWIWNILQDASQRIRQEGRRFFFPKLNNKPRQLVNQ